jgi:hypothetical protein
MKRTERNGIAEFVNAQEQQPTLFTNGAFISPRKIKIDDQVHWFWVVESFEEDTFYQGEVCNPCESARTKQELFDCDLEFD